VRPSTIVSLITALAVGVLALILGIYAFVERDYSKPWFFWIAPLLAIGFFGAMVNLCVGYWVKVGRLETKGRPVRETQ
jgi:hypothetical protein